MRTFSGKLSSLLFLLVLTLGFSATISAQDKVIVGVLHSQKYTYADMMKNSLEMAVEHINNNGGINEKPLKLVYLDDQGDIKKGEAVVIEAKEKHHVKILIGGYSSTNTLQMAKAADNLDIPLVVSTAADDRITKVGLKNVFRLNPPASEYTSGLETFLLSKVKPKNLSILYENSPYGTSAAQKMMSFCRKSNIDIKKIIPYARKKTDIAYLKRMIAPLQSSSPDVIYMVSYFKDGAALVNLLRESGVNSLLCGGAGGFTHPDFHKKVGEAADNLITATLWHHKAGHAEAEAYYSEYTSKFSTSPDYHGAEAYSALLVAADALKRADNHFPEAIRDALGKTNLDTPMGNVSFYYYGQMERQNSFSTFVLQIQNGKPELIWPNNIATSKYNLP